MLPYDLNPQSPRWNIVPSTHSTCDTLAHGNWCYANLYAGLHRTGRFPLAEGSSVIWRCRRFCFIPAGHRRRGIEMDSTNTVASTVGVWRGPACWVSRHRERVVHQKSGQFRVNGSHCTSVSMGYQTGLQPQKWKPCSTKRVKILDFLATVYLFHCEFIVTLMQRIINQVACYR